MQKTKKTDLIFKELNERGVRVVVTIQMTYKWMKKL